ncbi:excinuclease ABC subunit UvrA [Nonomuraea sp. NN258]|uniref:ATP-binding cassette domain-containing protein n=1 Tax=Nonomuraea antri TaxID=2730852 RepID=UPI001568F7D9|nr:excinuclease ABC subunit UvrA [Nonomuraea antri]NRQ39095.1 excinuclease ABC subunit UvrA [Nonomuraea antri]
MSRDIQLTGLRQNNLKNVSLRLPKERLTVFTGVSGSGKSSIVFGTIAAESQRQLNETYSAFLRNRLPKHERPKAERMSNLTAAVVVDQKPVGGGARSTVGTMTEVHAMLRVLFSRRGEPSAGPATAYSFNDPQGMCPECDGLGRKLEADLDALIDPALSLNQGALRMFPVGGYVWQLYARSGLFDPDKPLGEFTAEERELLLRGSGFKVDRGDYTNAYEGVLVRFDRVYLKRDLDQLDKAAQGFVRQGLCPACHGARLNEAALASRIGGRNLADYAAMEVTDLIGVLEGLDDPVAAAAVESLRRIDAIGLGYLSLDRGTSTLSGGEAQRLKTVRNLGSSLTGMTYIFDEPSVGLHPRDVHRLADLLVELRDKGNTVLVVEHDRDLITLADHIVDLGPGAGAAGGRVVFEGPVDGLIAGDTLTGRMLRRATGLKDAVRAPSGWLTIAGANAHNLKDVTVRVPLGVLTAVTGVAGSGKSTLMRHELIAQHPGTVLIDQSAIAASPRSTPATYLNAMDPLRKLFAEANGVEPAVFSFNSAGACPACKGRGEIKTDLAFMDPVTRVCDVCGGSRYSAEALSYTVGGRTIADVLAMTADEAARSFDLPGVARLGRLGLGYLTLGQPLSTLSGGERQRLKLAHRLRERGKVYVFDEPTTGLHMADIDTLLTLLDRLVDDGNTVIVVEHDLDVVKHADWVIDLGPEAGQHGGQVVFEGTPTDLTEAATYTAKYLVKSLDSSRPGRR